MTDDAPHKVIDLFNRNRPVEQKPAIHHDMERAVEQLQGEFPANMSAFVIFAVTDDGSWTTRHSCTPGSILGRRMLAGLACEGIRENLVTERCIEELMGWTNDTPPAG